MARGWRDKGAELGGQVGKIHLQGLLLPFIREGKFALPWGGLRSRGDKWF